MNSVNKAKLFTLACQGAGIPRAQTEFTFHPTRKWRFDYAWPEFRLALEVEGGAWTNGRHTRGSGFVRDLEKYSEAAALGWRIIRVVPDDLFTAKTFSLVRRAMEWRAAA